MSLAIQAGVMLALVPWGFATNLRTLAVFIAQAPSSSAFTAAVFAILLFVLFELLALPLRFYQTFTIERRYGLSAVSLRVWIADHLKSAGLGLVFALIAVGIVHATLVRWPTWWWLGSAAAFVLGAIILARIAPSVLLPIFYRFKPLDRAALRTRLESLSVRAGVPVLGVFEWGLGEKTQRANAALVGTGRSRRILVSDTLLAHYTDDEIEVILAHELGHHAHRDIRNGLILEALLIVASLGVAGLALHAAWPALGLEGPADAAALPLILMAAGAVSLLATPFLNALSRRNEHRADRFALTLTERPEAFVSAMRRLAAQNLAEERPSAATLLLFHTHPPFEQRIQAARAFLS
jgi:Zn-dependent protease with chaperone function